MTTRNISILFVVALASFNCNHRREEILLGQVTDLPDYFSQSFRFGIDMKSVKESGVFILITGKIDTTTETPPLRRAVIAVGRERIFLPLKKIRNDSKGTTEQYSGNGYYLDLVYKEQKVQNHSPLYEGYFVIEHGNSKSEYNVVGVPGD